eukprot:scaffold57328_cov22-Tisochrysis_lutea.AAC.3
MAAGMQGRVPLKNKLINICNVVCVEPICAQIQRHTCTLVQLARLCCRRGAAFGLAGVVKGLGLMAMKNCGIMDHLKAAVEDKKDPAAREGQRAVLQVVSPRSIMHSGWSPTTSLSVCAYCNQVEVGRTRGTTCDLLSGAVA